jgi:hypothetical protein
MASVSGSKLAFFVPGLTGDQVNVVLTTDGNQLSGPTVAGKFNIEVFTVTPGVKGSGFDGSAFIQGAVQISNNEIQAKTLTSTEQLLVGNYQVVDRTGSQLIQIVGSAGGSSTVTGSAGDTISGSTIPGNSQLIDISGTNKNLDGSLGVRPGAMTAIGGAGNTSVWAGTGDTFIGGSGADTVTANTGANNMKITGGTGNLTVFNIGKANTVTGSTSGFTFIDDNYGAGGSTISGGGGNGPGTDAGGGSFTQGTEIIAGKGDVILGGSGTMLVSLQKPGVTGVSVSGGSGASTIWGGPGDTITGGSGAMQFNGIGGSSVTGGAGALNAFDLGKGNTVSGGSSTNFIDDSYGGGGNNLLTGGAGGTTIIGGSGDTIVGGPGSLEARIKTGFGAETVNLSASGSSDGVRDVSNGGPGTAATVTGFNTANDVIESATNVTGGGVFTGSSSSTAAGTTLVFADGNTMFIAGVTNVASIKFTQ